MRELLSFACMAAVLVGCSTQIAGLKSSPSFTYSAIEHGKMAIGGVAATTENLDEGRRSSYATILRNALLEERKEYSIAPVGNVINRIGTSQYDSLMGELKTSGLLSDKSVKLLRAKVPGTRYVTFARLENDEVSKDRDETANHDRKGNVVEGSQRVIARTLRSVTATLLVYDLEASEVAWQGTVTKSMSNEHRYEKEKELGLVSVIKAIKGSGEQSPEQKYPYPAPPETQKVLAQVFEGFGENLPEKN